MRADVHALHAVRLEHAGRQQVQRALEVARRSVQGASRAGGFVVVSGRHVFSLTGLVLGGDGARD